MENLILFVVTVRMVRAKVSVPCLVYITVQHKGLFTYYVTMCEGRGDLRNVTKGWRVRVTPCVSEK